MACNKFIYKYIFFFKYIFRNRLLFFIIFLSLICFFYKKFIFLHFIEFFPTQFMVPFLFFHLFTCNLLRYKILHRKQPHLEYAVSMHTLVRRKFKNSRKGSLFAQ